MRFLALNHHLEPALSERHGHDAHIEAAIFQQLALFDMQLEIGGAILQGGRIGDWAPERAGVFLAELIGGQIGLATPLIFLFCAAGAGLAGARAWRRHLATEAVKRGAGLEVLRDAMAHVSREAAAA
jgi:hypothetical protein